jgi:hypothetical protein
VPKASKAKGEVTEDLATKGALFDIETAEGTFKIVLPVLEPEEPEESS